MRYIGSKLKLLSFIEDTITDFLQEDISQKVFCDLFSGTGIVAKHFKPKVKFIMANDLEFYSYVVNKDMLERNEQSVQSVAYLNDIIGTHGFITEEYALKRMYFTVENAMKIDGIREEIRKLNGDMHWYALSALLQVADKVSNTTGMYSAYLKYIKESTIKPLMLEDFPVPTGEGVVYQQDANELIGKVFGDILYLDPPYNHRQYGSNYHILNTIARGVSFVPKGISGLPPEYNKSLYCSKRQAKDALYDVIQNANFPFIFLSYNNEGIISTQEIQDMFSRFGTYKQYEKEHQRYKSNNNGKPCLTKVVESIHCLAR